MYAMLFMVGLPGQFFFGVASMTLSAVATTYLFGLAYFAATGTYFFYDSYVPIAIFLGMHLLFTDPSTSPKTELGRLAFGVLYGLSSIALYQWLGWLELPTFYDKLLQVPVLNLSIRFLDRPGPIGLAFPARPGAVRASAHPSPAPCRVSVTVGGRLRRHERRAGRRRSPSWTMAAVLGERLPGRTHARL